METAFEGSQVDEIGLGRLQRLDPREAWRNEALDLSPWIHRNMDVLSSALGISIVPLQREVYVGNFKLDLLGEDEHGRTVIIENQLEPTDHGHLGQLIVYASGLEAGIVVWVTRTFRPEHRRAIDWLNERTDEKVDFFGVELELVRIGDSPFAPVFRVVAQPNDWQKSVKPTGASAPLTEVKQHRAELYAAIMDAVAASRPGFRPTKTSPDWVGMASGPFGFYGISFAQKNRLRVDIYLDLGDKEKTKALFDSLESDRAQFEAAVGETLSWERLDDARASRIAAYLPAPRLEAPEERDAACAWASQRLCRLMDAFDARLRREAREIRSR